MQCDVVQGSLIEKAHAFVSEMVSAGDTVVDATVGNGHDTLFLSKCLGADGKVIGFDVQQQALDATEKRLSKSSVPWKLHYVGHEEMDDYVSQGVAVVMFNLGYLPGSDKTTITRRDTTLLALDKAMVLLRPGGLLSVMCYPGHEGGEDEAQAVVGFFENQENARVFRRKEAGERSPFLIIAHKNGQPHEEAGRKF